VGIPTEWLATSATRRRSAGPGPGLNLGRLQSLIPRSRQATGLCRRTANLAPWTGFAAHRLAVTPPFQFCPLSSTAEPEELAYFLPEKRNSSSAKQGKGNNSSKFICSLFLFFFNDNNAYGGGFPWSSSVPFCSSSSFEAVFLGQPPLAK
jgi:hypothetical protein